MPEIKTSLNRYDSLDSRSGLDLNSSTRFRSNSVLKSTDNLAFKRYYKIDNDSTTYLPETHWNDWFGKPGGGAPTQSPHKKNLDHMLEPPRSRNYEYETFKQNYNDLPFRRNDSNHHNYYEIKNPQFYSQFY